MTASAIGSSQPVHTHRRHHADAAQSNPLAPAPATAKSAAPSTASPVSSSGIQKFASELQSILLQAQSGQASADGSTSNNPATPADPSGASDLTASQSQGGPIRHIAERLQSLLNSGSSSSGPAATSGQPQSLQSVLDTLQQTLQQKLQSYATASPATATTALTA